MDSVFLFNKSAGLEVGAVQKTLPVDEFSRRTTKPRSSRRESQSCSPYHKENIILIRKISVLWLFIAKMGVFCPFRKFYSIKTGLPGVVYSLQAFFTFSRKIQIIHFIPPFVQFMWYRSIIDLLKKRLDFSQIL